jgi:glycosyltransferase involved in cell wall biosynthesis
MKRELQDDFRVPPSKISVIPFGINNTVPDTELTQVEARGRLGLTMEQKVLLFFGNIAPYKGLHCLVDAFALLAKGEPNYRLVIAGRPKGDTAYWQRIESTIRENNVGSRIIKRIEYVPDEDTEVYFKAADVVVLPYTHVFQSGVLFLGYNFGLPVIASDVGSLSDDIIPGKTGFVCQPRDSADLANCIRRYFSSDLYKNLDLRRQEIRDFASERYSWGKVGEIARSVYQSLLTQS